MPKARFVVSWLCLGAQFTRPAMPDLNFIRPKSNECASRSGASGRRIQFSQKLLARVSLLEDSLRLNFRGFGMAQFAPKGSTRGTRAEQSQDYDVQRSGQAPAIYARSLGFLSECLKPVLKSFDQLRREPDSCTMSISFDARTTAVRAKLKCRH
jgi:hypothetical protein